jgi:hypothetical protein
MAVPPAQSSIRAMREILDDVVCGVAASGAGVVLAVRPS